MEVNENKYVFVCGLHRSGTSVLGRNIARFEHCTGFRNTGVTEDEGQFLQDVYPITFQHGGPGRFGFDPRTHRTESSPFLTPENVTRLRDSWHAHWDNSKRICVEKTPANLVMTRFLQAAFPNSYFVVIRRHPVAVSIATQNMWKINMSPLHRLFEHWLYCHDLFQRDKPYLRHVYELSYEDYVENPDTYHRDIAAFIGTRVSEARDDDAYRYVVRVGDQPISRVLESALEEVSRVHNAKYLKQWSDLLTKSSFRKYYCYIARRYEESFNKHGYSLLNDLKNTGRGDARRATSAASGHLYCLGADVYALSWRVAARAKEYLLRTSKAIPSRENRRAAKIVGRSALVTNRNPPPLMEHEYYSSYKYVFVCGLHRSGTSVLAHNIANLENCTGFKNAPPCIPDEGQNLQDVYPFESEFGGPGKFGFDPRAHLTETSELLTPDNVASLHASWHSYWDMSKTIFVEKTPGNLLMTRFLQAAFPNSYFIIIRRHPIPVSMGTPKLGQATATSLHRLFAHWVYCHDIFEQDKKYLRHVYELTYEEYVADPGRYHQEIAAFIGTRAPENTTVKVKSDLSNKYFDQWDALLTMSVFNSYYRYVATKYEPQFAKYGYPLSKPVFLPREQIIPDNSETSVALGSFYCLGADAYAFLMRVLSWPSPNTRRRIKAVLPESVVSMITQVRRKAVITKGQAEIRPF